MIYATVRAAFYWMLAVAPSLPYVLLYGGYRKNLFHKRDALANLMSQKGVFDSYQARFGRAGDNREQVVDQLFDLYFRGSSYWLAIGMNVAVVSLGVAIGMARAGVRIWIPGNIDALSRSAPLTLSMGFAGAYILGLYDTLGRCRTADLSPYSLHFTWVHMILASILAPLVGEGFNATVAPIVAFGLGLFPIRDTVDFIRESTKKRVEIRKDAAINVGPALTLVQGLNNNDVIDRLEEEGAVFRLAFVLIAVALLFLHSKFNPSGTTVVAATMLVCNRTDIWGALLVAGQTFAQRPGSSKEILVIYSDIRQATPRLNLGRVKEIANRPYHVMP